MNLEPQKYLHDVLQAARDIAEYTTGLEFDDFRHNDLVQSAVERKFEIIGEALNRMSQSNPEMLQQISDYQRIIGFRNIITHGYDIVDAEIVWEAVKDYLPVLVSEVQGLLKV